jgi:hypothetical protein
MIFPGRGTPGARLAMETNDRAAKREARGHHCPLLDRPEDDRCSQHFHLDDLQHAFAHCFDRFRACPVYKERRAELRAMRAASAAAADGPESEPAETTGREQVEHRQILVQISVPARYARRGAAQAALAQPAFHA